MEKVTFDKEMQPFSLERSILIIVNAYLDFFFFFLTDTSYKKQEYLESK